MRRVCSFVQTWMLNAYTTGCSLLVCSVLSKNSIDIGQLRTDMVTLKSSRWLCLFHPVFSFIASSTFCSCYAKMNSEQAFIKIRERLMHGNVQALGLTWEGHHLPGAFRAAWHWPIDLQCTFSPGFSPLMHVKTTRITDMHHHTCQVIEGTFYVTDYWQLMQGVSSYLFHIPSCQHPIWSFHLKLGICLGPL